MRPRRKKNVTTVIGSVSTQSMRMGHNLIGLAICVCSWPRAGNWITATAFEEPVDVAVCLFKAEAKQVLQARLTLFGDLTIHKGYY